MLFTGLSIVIISQICLFLQIEPFYTFFYEFAWWGYILFVDGLVYKRTGASLIRSRRGEFLLMLPVSVAWWLFFELVNLRLCNWHYTGLPGNIFLRWQGYLFAYATVLPAIFETKELLESFSFFKDLRTRPMADLPRFGSWFLITGVVFLVLPLAFPKYFFPLIWGSFILILEPLVCRLGERSLLKDLSSGLWSNLLLLLAAGAICGFLWEFWNFWAKAKWIYTVPFFGGLKIFEMPVLGFLGFPPFAVMSYSLWNFVLYLKKRKRFFFFYRMIPVYTPYYAVCFFLIDRFTVKSYF